MSYTQMVIDHEHGTEMLESLEETLRWEEHNAQVAHDHALQQFANLQQARRDLKDTKRALRRLERAMWIEEQLGRAREARRKVARRLPKLPKVKVSIER